MIKKIAQYKVFLILFSLLIFTTIISTYNPFKITLLAADNIPACISTCTDYTGNYDSYCETFCDPYSYGYYGYDNSCAYQSYPETNAVQWCSSVEMDVEMCIGGCIVENPDATDVVNNCRALCSAYNDTFNCIDSAGGYLYGDVGFTPSTSFCSYLDFRDEINLCYSACTTELGGGYESQCSTFCNPYDYGYYGYEWQVGGTGGCTEASQYYNYNYPQPGLWCSYLETNSQMCTGACIAQNSSYQDPEFPCNDICTAYTVTSECAADAGSYFEYFTPTTDFCSYLEYVEEQEEDGISFNLGQKATIVQEDSYTLEGRAVSFDQDPISTIQYRLFDSEQAEGDNWNGCTCDDGTCDNMSEDFTCEITNIPITTSTYEIRFGDGDPLAYITSTDYGRFDITTADAESLISWWTFDGTTEITDYGTNALNGTLEGNAGSSISTTTGSATNVFDGNTYFTIPDTDRKVNFNGAIDEFAIELDIKPDAGLDTNAEYHFIYKTKSSWGDGEQPYVWGIKMYVTGAGVYSARGMVDSDGERAVGFEDNSDTFLNPGQWNHIVFTYSNVDEVITLKVNDNDTIIAEVNETMYLDESTAPILIGSRSTEDGGKFVGELDNVKIYIPGPVVEDNPPIMDIDNPYILKDDNLTTEITGTVMDYSGVSSVDIKRADGETWNSCTLTDTTGTPSIPSPVAHWSLDELSGTGAFLLDDSGNDLHATPIDTYTVTGMIANARGFDGDADHLDTSGDQTVLPDGSEARTIAVWVKANSLGNWINQVFHYGDTEENQAWGLAIYDDQTFGVHEWGVHQTAGYVNLNEWTHLAIALDDSGNKTYYQNGIEVGTSNNTPNTDTNGRIARIGSNPNGDGDFFNGLIDEVYLFDSKLTQEQILNVYKTGFHTYDYSCWTGPLEDLATNIYEIKATDSEANFTTTETYVEADDFGGLTLKSLWRFEDRDNIEDELGFANDGVYSDDPERSLVDGLYGKAIDLEWDRRVFIDDEGGDFTFRDADYIPHIRFEGIIKRGVYAGEGMRTVLSKETPGHRETIWKATTTDEGYVECELNLLGGRVTATGSDVLTDDQWYKVGCDWNSSTGELKAYLDGSQTGDTVTTDIDISQREFPESTGRLVLGGMGQDGYFDPLSGYLDNTKIYYEAIGKPEENIPPTVIVDGNSKFQIVNDGNNVEVTGSVSDDSGTSTVEIRKIGEGWNSCQIDGQTTEATLPTPLAKWSLEEETGVDAYILDSGSGGYNGTPANTVFTTGIVGNAREFVADEARIEIDSNINSILPSGSEARTVSAWIKLESTGCPFGQNPIFSYGGDDAAWGLVVNCDHRFGIHEGNYEDYVDVIIPSWQWNLLTVTMDSDGNKTHYLNGENVGVLTHIPNTNPDYSPKIGTFYNLNHYFYGKIDEVSIFDTELTEGQVAEIYKETRDNYGFSCDIASLGDLTTNAYEIRATDTLDNVTEEGNYSSAIVEVDETDGLELISLWRFEEKENIIDSMGLANNGTYSYEPERNLIEGLYGNGYDLNWDRRVYIDDSDEKYSFNTSVGELPHIRAEAAARRDLFGNGEQRVLLSKETTDGQDYIWKVGVDGTGGVKCSFRTIGGLVEVISDETVGSNEWHTVGCDWNASTGELIALLDGVEVETTTTEIESSQRATPESTGRLIIGGMGQEGGFDPLSGYMDNVKIYYETLIQPLDFMPFEFTRSSAIVSTNSYTLQGTAETATQGILSIQYRIFDSEQEEGENWNSCTCDDGNCNSIIEDFTCNITNIPDFTSTYELRLGYGEPLEYITSEIYGRFDITKDTLGSLVTWWGFDSDTDITDYGVNELNGTLNGYGETSISSDTGSRTNVFDGDTYFEIPDTDRKLNFNGLDDEFTVELDIKPEVGFNTNQDYFVMSKNAPDSSFVWGIKIHVTSEGNYNIRGIINSDGNTREVGLDNPNAFLIPGDWNHVVFSFANLDSTATIKVNDNPPSVYSNNIYFLMPTSSSPITIGSLASGGNKFVGEIGDIKILSSADARSPQVTFTELDNTERITNDPDQEFEITVTDQTGVESFGYFFFNMSGSWDIPEPDFMPIVDREWIYVDNPTEGNWGDKEVVIRINAVDLADDIWYLYTRATDSNGFESLLPGHWWYTSYADYTPSAMPYYQFFVEAQDTTPPQIFAHSIIPSQTVDTNPGVRGYVKDNPIDTVSDIASLEYKLEIGTLEGEVWTPGEIGIWQPITPLGIENVFDQPTEEFYLKLENLIPGDYKLVIRAEDASGNSTEDNETNHSGYFTIYEINPKPDTTVLIKEEDFNSHAYHDLLFSDGVWGNGILRLRQAVAFQQEQVFFTNNNDFGYEYGEYRGKISDSIDGNLWITNNDTTFTYYNIENDTYIKYPRVKDGVEFDRVHEFEFEGRRYLILDYTSSSTIIYDINNTPENITDDNFVDYGNKNGFEDHKDFTFANIDTRNNTLAIFAKAESAVENFVISIDTKKTVMDLSDDTYVTWGTADNLFYDEDLEAYHTDHNIVGLLLDPELNSFVMSSYTHGSWVCSDGGDPENKANDTCKYYPTWGKFIIIKDDNGYYWMGGNGRLVRIDSKNTPSILDDTLAEIISGTDPIVQGDTIADMIIIPGTYPVGDELWFITSNGYLRGIEYNFTYDDKLDDTSYVYKIPTHLNRSGSGSFLGLRGDDTFYILSQAKGVQKISLTRSFESLNTIEMLPIPPDGILAINYIDLEEVLGSVTNGSEYTLNDLVTYEVSNDSGVTWYPITQGNRVEFPTPDYKLKLKIILRSGSSPIIDALTLSYITYPDQEENSCDIKINDKAPQITTIQPNTNQSFTVNFAPLTDLTVQSYRLEYGLSSSNFTTGSQTVSSGTNSFNVTNIEIDKEYFFRVKAVSDCTSSLWSNVVSATNTNSPNEPIVVAPPITPTTPTVTTNLCGNGILDEGEQCDYANTETYMCEDGTTAVCTVECTLDASSCEKEDSNIPIIDKIKENIKEVENNRDSEAISAAQVANWAVKLISLSLLTLSVPLIPYYLMRILIGIPYVIGMRKREKEYGYVYDSVTKEPIKQAIVRIYSGDKLVHTDVTGTYGEFGGNIEPGKYTLVVQKPQYSFPSSRVVGTTDMHISNVYNGTLEVQENAEIITAVPIDSNKAKVFDTFKTIVINRSAILLQFIKLLLFVGLLAYSIYAYKTNSSTLNLIVLIEYAIVLAVLLFSSLSRDIKYGKITNAYDEPVVGVNVGLFEREFNKLQTERITNEKGQYRFIIKPGTYEIRSLTPGYTLQSENVITVNDKPSIINKNLKITNSR